jgi:hypothetical protein
VAGPARPGSSLNFKFLVRVTAQPESLEGSGNCRRQPFPWPGLAAGLEATVTAGGPGTPAGPRRPGPFSTKTSQSN